MGLQPRCPPQTLKPLMGRKMYLRYTQYMDNHRKHTFSPTTHSNPNCTLCPRNEIDTWPHLLSQCSSQYIKGPRITRHNKALHHIVHSLQLNKQTNKKYIHLQVPINLILDQKISRSFTSYAIARATQPQPAQYNSLNSTYVRTNSPSWHTWKNVLNITPHQYTSRHRLESKPHHRHHGMCKGSNS